MKHLKRLCATCVLTAILALPAFAGEMTTGIVEPPPPPPVTTQGNMQAGYAGNMEAGSTGNIETTNITATDSATGIALSLFQSLLALV